MEKHFTQEQAMEEIFAQNNMSAKMITYRSRYKNGKLAQKAIDEILSQNNFVVINPTLYIKK